MTEISIDLSIERRINVSIEPKMTYSPAILAIKAKFGAISLQVDNDQLGEIGEAIRVHLEQSRYNETPDQQLIHNMEHKHAIEEAIA